MQDTAARSSAIPARRLVPGRGWSGLGLVALCLPMLLTHAPGVLAQGEAGSATLVFQFHEMTSPATFVWNGPVFTLTVPTVSSTNLRADARQWVPNVGFVNGSVDIGRRDGAVSIGRGAVELSQFSAGAWRIGAVLGDEDLSVGALELRLASLHQAYAGLRGATVTATRGSVTASAYGGRVTLVNGLFGENASPTDQTAYGARVGWRWGRSLLLGVSGLRAMAGPGPVRQDRPRDSTELTADGIVRTKGVDLLGEVSLAFYGGADRLARPSGRDLSYLVGARTGPAGRTMEVSYLRLGPVYLPVGQVTLGDRAGIYASGEYSASSGFAVHGAFSQFRNNLGSASNQPALHVRTATAGARAPLGRRFFIGMRGSAGVVDGLARSDHSLSSRTRTLGLDLSQQAGRTALTLRATDIRSDEGASRHERGEKRRADLEVRQSLGSRGSAWGTAGIVREERSREEGRRNSLAGRLGTNWSLGGGTSIFSEVSWNQENRALRTSSIHNLTFSGGLNANLPGGYLLSFSGRYSRDESRLSLFDSAAVGPDEVGDLATFLMNRNRSSYQVHLRVQKTSRWGSRPVAEAGSLAADALPPPTGNVDGVVFTDLDADGRLGAGEPPQAGIGVWLDGKTRVVTDAAGRFTYRNVPVGSHALALDVKSVPAAFDVGALSEAVVVVSKRQPSSVTLGVTRLGRLRGTVVVLDRRESPGAWQAELAAGRATPAVDVVVLLNDNARATVTDADGEFEFTGLPPGEYRVRLDPNSLPESWAPLLGETPTVAVRPGDRGQLATLAVGIMPRPARRVVLQGQSRPLPLRAATREPDEAWVQPSVPAAAEEPVATPPTPCDPVARTLAAAACRAQAQRASLRAASRPTTANGTIHPPQ